MPRRQYAVVPVVLRLAQAVVRRCGAVRYLLAVLIAMTIGLAPATVLADDGSERSDATDAAAATPGVESQRRGGQPQQADFLFGPPRGSFGIRGGWLFASADSEIFDFVNDELTLEKGDFDSAVVGFDFAWRLNPRTDIVVGLEFSRASKVSEYRDYVDQNDVPIVQETFLSVVPLTASLKFYLTSRGREVGGYAFVPSDVAAYVGGGGGVTFYEFKQEGEFVDFVDMTIFVSEFSSDGGAASAHVFGGVEVKLNKKLNLALEARYVWASASMSSDFIGFDDIDLSGLRSTAGIHWKF